jgi:hypothetical protein
VSAVNAIVGDEMANANAVRKLIKARLMMGYFPWLLFCSAQKGQLSKMPTVNLIALVLCR